MAEFRKPSDAEIRHRHNLRKAANAETSTKNTTVEIGDIVTIQQVVVGKNNGDEVNT